MFTSLFPFYYSCSTEARKKESTVIGYKVCQYLYRRPSWESCGKNMGDIAITDSEIDEFRKNMRSSRNKMSELLDVKSKID